MKKGQCALCNRKGVVLVTKDGKCHVCGRVTRIAGKLAAGTGLSASEQATMQRVRVATPGGTTERIAAEKLGLIGTVEGPRVSGADRRHGERRQAVPTGWPRPVQQWECSDGSKHDLEVDALRRELGLCGRVIGNTGAGRRTPRGTQTARAAH